MSDFVWPMGYGLTLTKLETIPDGRGIFSVLGLPNDLEGRSGEDVTHELWDEVWAMDGPKLQLGFKDIAAVEDTIKKLHRLKRAMKKIHSTCSDSPPPSSSDSSSDSPPPTIVLPSPTSRDTTTHTHSG